MPADEIGLPPLSEAEQEAVAREADRLADDLSAMFLLVLWHIRSKVGRSWEVIRQSEPAALAAGMNMTLYKLWAFALASFITGVAGALLAANVGKPVTTRSPRARTSFCSRSC